MPYLIISNFISYMQQRLLGISTQMKGFECGGVLYIIVLYTTCTFTLRMSRRWTIG